MFELNLIKDKAKARQRRRIIFLSIAGIFLLSGLVSISVGGLFWGMVIEVNGNKRTLADMRSAADTLEADLNRREPAAKTRRNALIRAWNEDSRVLAERPSFAPALMDVVKHRPASVEFWYNSIAINLPTRASGPRGASADAGVAASELLEGRNLMAQGYIQVESSHIITDSELESMVSRMNNLRNLVGPASYDLDEQNEIIPGGGGDTTKYLPFTMSATQNVFRAAE